MQCYDDHEMRCASVLQAHLGARYVGRPFFVCIAWYAGIQRSHFLLHHVADAARTDAADSLFDFHQWGIATNKPEFDGEWIRLGDVVIASKERNRDLTCEYVYSVTNSRGFTPSTEYFSKEVFSDDLKAYRVVRRGMIAYNPSRINVGSVALQDKLPEVVVSPLYVVFAVDEDKLLPEYLLAFLKSGPGLAQIAFRSTGTVRNNLRFETLCQLEMKLPPIEAQRKRVGLLSEISGQIEHLDELRASLDDLVKSQFVEMFGDPVSNARGWSVATLGSTCEIVTGNTPSRSDSANYGDYLEWCKTDNITSGKYLTPAVELLSKTGAAKARSVPSGSILMACIAGSINSIGRVAIANRKVSFNQQINALVPGERLNRDYLYWMLRLSKDYLCTGVNMQLKGILNKSTLSGKEFPLPPLALQRQFADFVAKVDKLGFGCCRMTTYCDALFSSVSARLLRT